MREIAKNKWIIVFFAVILFLVFSISSKIYANISTDITDIFAIKSNEKLKLDNY